MPSAAIDVSQTTNMCGASLVLGGETCLARFAQKTDRFAFDAERLTGLLSVAFGQPPSYRNLAAIAAAATDWQLGNKAPAWHYRATSSELATSTKCCIGPRRVKLRVTISPCHQCAIERVTLMAASKTERLVYLWHIMPHAVPTSSDVDVSLAEVLGLLEEAYNEKSARVFITGSNRILDDDCDPSKIDPRNQIYIADFQRNARRNTVTMLINRGDPDTVSPAFIDSEEYGVRVEHPNEKESPGWSAHLVVGLGLQRGVHRACFEKMPRVSTSLALGCLDKIITRKAKQKGIYTWARSFRKGKEIIRENKEYRPVLGVKKLPSETLENDLKQGALSSITLTKRKSFYEGVGAADIVKRQEEKVILKTQPVDDTRMKRFIAAVTAQAKEEGYESISFSVDDLPGNRSSSPTISLHEEDALEALYVRAQRLTDFPGLLEGCYERVCKDIESRLIEIIVAPHFAGRP